MGEALKGVCPYTPSKCEGVYFMSLQCLQSLKWVFTPRELHVWWCAYFHWHFQGAADACTEPQRPKKELVMNHNTWLSPPPTPNIHPHLPFFPVGMSVRDKEAATTAADERDTGSMAVCANCTLSGPAMAFQS